MIILVALACRTMQIMIALTEVRPHKVLLLLLAELLDFISFALEDAERDFDIWSVDAFDSSSLDTPCSVLVAFAGGWPTWSLSLYAVPQILFLTYGTKWISRKAKKFASASSQRHLVWYHIWWMVVLLSCSMQMIPFYCQIIVGRMQGILSPYFVFFEQISGLKINFTTVKFIALEKLSIGSKSTVKYSLVHLLNSQ